jgi:hypothetical protein
MSVGVFGDDLEYLVPLAKLAIGSVESEFFANHEDG